MQQKIAIIDFGGQYTHLIARRIRHLGVYSEIYHPEDFILEESADLCGIILSGGPKSVLEKDSYNINFNINKLKVPILGICYGHQLIALKLYGVIKKGHNKEYGLTEISCDNKTVLFNGVNEKEIVWMSHGDHVEKLPDNFIITAHSNSIPIAGFESKDKMIFGLQFHPEVIHTKNGLKILDNFINVCTKERLWKTENYEKTIIKMIKKKAGSKKLFLLLSGGVDSLVSLILCIKALRNENIYPLHIDTGFMRENESEEIKEYCTKLGFKNLKVVNYEKLFLEELKGITEPEEKRNIIGKLFVDILHKELSKIDLKDDWLLVQGTIYPDTIESGETKNSAKIKTHHNRVEEIEKLIKENKVIEPIKDLYKDEVRELGKSIGLPANLVNRHPFPGPGLAIRIIASDKDNIDDNYKKEEENLNDFLKEQKLKAHILPIKSVGVQGDFRTYHHPTLIWYNNTDLNYSWKDLNNIASLIINKFETINRVVFSYEKINERLKPIKLLLEKSNIDLLRKVDSYLMKKVENIKEIWQMPVVSLPLSDNNCKQAFVMRPVCSQDAMTANVYEMDFSLLKELSEGVKKIDKAGPLLYDITTKPPATIEWE